MPTRSFSSRLLIVFCNISGPWELAIKSGRNGIDVVIDMGAFRHSGKEQELLEYERTFNITSRGSKSSILCCYHKKDVEALDATRKEEIHKSHLKNYIVKEEE
jgi:hypothetical protein